MKLLVIGRGKMGRLIRETAEAAGDQVEAMLGRDDLEQLGKLGRVADVVIDFSRPEALAEICAYVRRTGTPLLSGTTGYTPDQLARLRGLGEAAPVLWSANYSLGVAVLYRALRQVSDVLKPDFDVELTETHHNQKADAPSGTAKLLLDAIVEAEPEAGYHPVYGREGMCGARDPKEIGMHSLRGGTVAGVHEVSFFGQDEEVTLTHRATSRQIFVNGALAAAQKLVTHEPGFYTFDQIMFA